MKIYLNNIVNVNPKYKEFIKFDILDYDNKVWGSFYYDHNKNEITFKKSENLFNLIDYGIIRIN